MSDLGTVIVPLVIVVVAGFLAGRYEIVGTGLRKPLLDFCLYFGIPALVFRTIATSGPSMSPPYAIWLAYLLPVALCWSAASAIVGVGRRAGTTSSASVALAATYGNVLMLGIPIAILHFGSRAAATIAMIVLVHSPVLFAAAAIHAASQSSTGNTYASVPFGSAPHVPDGILPRLARIGIDLATNPIIIAILSGLAIRGTGVPVPLLADKALAIIGQGTLPCVLISVGLGLSTFQVQGRLGLVSTIVLLKLVAMPAFAWWVSAHILGLDDFSVALVTFLCAMPVGANALAFAEASGERADSISAAVAISTILSPFSLSLVLWAVALMSATL